MLSPWNRVFDPLFPIDGLLRSFEQLAAELSPPASSRGAAGVGGAADFELTDDGETLRLRADVPGLTTEELEVEATATSINVQGRRRPAELEGYRRVRQERPSLEFARSFQLPTRIDVESVNATLEHGVLQLTMHKHEAERPRQISIKAD